MTPPEHYSKSPIFDQDTLPESLQHEHSTKVGVWGLLRVLEGEVNLVFLEPRHVVHVTVDRPAPIPPEAVHHVELIGPMRMQVEFFREPPIP